MNILKELLDLFEAGMEKADFSKERDAAYARAKWHKAQAAKHKSDDQEAYNAHNDAEMDWINISQEFGHKNPTVAQRAIVRAEQKLAKASATARAETDQKFPS